MTDPRTPQAVAAQIVNEWIEMCGAMPIYASLAPLKEAIASALTEITTSRDECAAVFIMDREHELTGPIAECACPSCSLHLRYRSALTEAQQERDKIRKEAKALSLDDAVKFAESDKSEMQQRLRWFQAIVALQIENHTLEAALAEAERGRVQAEPARWQPIDMAPKDGTEVLVAVDGGVDIANWQEEKPDGTECGVVVDPGLPAGWYGYLGLCPWDKEQPTHWQPVPAPPVGVPDQTPMTDK